MDLGPRPSQNQEHGSRTVTSSPGSGQARAGCPHVPWWTVNPCEHLVRFGRLLDPTAVGVLSSCDGAGVGVSTQLCS